MTKPVNCICGEAPVFSFVGTDIYYQYNYVLKCENVECKKIAGNSSFRFDGTEDRVIKQWNDAFLKLDHKNPEEEKPVKNDYMEGYEQGLQRGMDIFRDLTDRFMSKK